MSNYFKRFGSIQSIRVQKKTSMCVIQFDKEASLKRALASKKLLFGKPQIVISLDPTPVVKPVPKKTVIKKPLSGSKPKPKATVKEHVIA